MVLYIIPGVSLPMVQAAPTPPTKEKIITTVFDYLKVPITEVRTKCRKRESVQARQIAMYLIRRELKISDSKVGKIFRRDRTTVIHSEQVVEGFMKVEKPFRAKMAEITNLLRN